ncbi:MAG TPA: helix-turn-helix domain-containing protein [Roseiarcus sp.]|jgi:AraC-like DNA-binding protein
MSESPRIQAVAAPEPLRRWVAAAWHVDAPHGHEVHTTPDASIDIVIVSNEAFDGIFVGGPLRTFMKRALRGQTRLAGLSLRPGFGALLGVSAEALPADWTPLAAFELSGAKVVPEEGLAGLFRFIEARAEVARFDERVAETIVRLDQSQRGLSVASLARQTGLGERSLRRLFERHVGMPPAAYVRILRFNRALKRLRTRRKERLVEAALSLGFADQSHLARDLRGTRRRHRHRASGP